MRKWSKRITVLAMALLVTGLAFGAGQQAAPAAASGQLRAAMLMSGPINDGGWNTSAYEGLMKLKNELGFEVAYSELVPQAEHLNILRNYARRGYDIIFGHGYEFGEAIATVAQEFPNLKFYQVGGDVKAANAGSGVFATGELSYLMGKLAAKFTKTNKIGFVGAMAIPTIEIEVNQMRDTIKQYNPGATFTVAYTGSWVDVVKGKEAALAQIANGVDVILAIGDACDLGAIQAAEEKGGFVIGWSGDFNSVSPKVVLTSGVQSVPDLVLKQGEAVKAGTWKAEHKVWGILEGVQFPGVWASVVPAALKAEIMADFEAIKAGKMDKRVLLGN
jgi:basic membrane protein A